MPVENSLSVEDRFSIFEQLNLHQRCIDNDGSRTSAEKYADLYWPEASFVIHDKLRDAEFAGPDGMMQMYDYAHRVFPLHKWWHSLGNFQIDGSGNRATVEWRWIVSWKEDREGVVSTGTYSDRFEKRGGTWKCLERVSQTDPNWPVGLFQSFVEAAESAL